MAAQNPIRERTDASGVSSGRAGNAGELEGEEGVKYRRWINSPRPQRFREISCNSTSWQGRLSTCV